MSAKSQIVNVSYSPNISEANFTESRAKIYTVGLIVEFARGAHARRADNIGNNFRLWRGNWFLQGKWLLPQSPDVSSAARNFPTPTRTLLSTGFAPAQPCRCPPEPTAIVSKNPKCLGLRRHPLALALSSKFCDAILPLKPSRMKLRRILLAAYFLHLTPAHGQTLLYSLTYSETRASSQARLANLPRMPGQRTQQQNLDLLRNTRKNEIYSLSLADGTRTLLFSDEGMNLEIKASTSVAGEGRAYAIGTWREYRSTPTPGVYSDDAVYQLALDRSNQYREIAPAPARQPLAILNPRSNKALLPSYGDHGFLVSIYAVPEWNLLHSWNLTELVRDSCGGCTPVSYGWLADGQRVFVNLTVVGDEGEDTADQPGAYLFSEAGGRLGTIPAEVGALQVAGYVHLERHLLGQLPDGRYLLLDYAAKQGTSPRKTEPFLVLSSPNAKVGRALPLRFPIGTVFVSPSGKSIAYLEDRHLPTYRTEVHLWVKDVETGAEREVFAAPPPPPPNSLEPNVTLRLLGWVE